MTWGVSLKWAFLVPLKPLYNFQSKHWLLQPSNCPSFNLIFTRYCRCLEPVTNMWCTVIYKLHLLCRKCWVNFCSWMNIWHHWMNVKFWINLPNCWMEWSWYWIHLRIQISIHPPHELLFLWIGIQITVSYECGSKHQWARMSAKVLKFAPFH